MLAYNVETKQYYSVAPSQGYDECEEDVEERQMSEVSKECPTFNTLSGPHILI